MIVKIIPDMTVSMIEFPILRLASWEALLIGGGLRITFLIKHKNYIAAFAVDWYL